MKLGILVVYFLADERIPVLDLHLRALESRTTGDFCIHAVAPRVSGQVRAVLAAHPKVRLHDIEPTSSVGSKEHSYYLDRLCELALADGAQRLCTMDVDAFPVVNGWNERLESSLGGQLPLAAVFRQENDDTALPHPCCCYFTREFHQAFRPTFLPDGDAGQDAAYEQFLRQTGQKADSGIGLGLVLWQHQLPWHKLLRSNKVNDHYLLAGIYGDLVFHLGAMSWTDRDFRKDRNASLPLRLLDALAQLLRRLGIFRGAVAVGWRQANYVASRPLVERTNQTFQRILDQLSLDADAYIDRLRGK